MTTRPLPVQGGETASIAVEPIRRPATILRPATGPIRWLRAHWTDEWAVGLLATVLSIVFFAWYDAHGLTVAFNDARIRELIAQRVLMSRTPGLAQLGTTWLPLPFMLMLPFIWNDTLFRTGIAGSLPAMLAYVIAAVYVYRSARLFTSSRRAGWVAAAVLALNPSVLYMQSTPMSEIPSLSAFVVAIYYALKLTRTYHAADIVKCAFAAAAGTLIRYENWVFAIALLPVVAYAAWRQRGYALAESFSILYAVLAFAGCAAWLVYNAVIFHDPLLSFFYGNRSHTYYLNTPAYMLPARHHAMRALVMYGLTVADTAGWALIIMAVPGFVIFAWRSRLLRTTLPAYLLLAPFAFYWLALYQGVNTEILSLPGLGSGPLYNVRFGLAMIPAVALFVSFLTVAGPKLLKRILTCVALAAILVSGIVSTIHTPFVLREALHGSAGAEDEVAGQGDANWLSSHYHGGNILITYVNNPTMIFYLLTAHHLSNHALITDANGPQFAGALADPQRWVTWIVMTNGVDSVGTGQDPLWNALQRQSAWRRYFILRETLPWHHSADGYSGTVQVFERRPAAGPAADHADARAGQARPPASVIPRPGQAHPAPSVIPRPGQVRPAPSVTLSPLGAQGVDEQSTYAGLAIDNDLSTAWKTQWYLGNPVFGGLKPGAGLVLDMGHSVRLSSVQVTFGPVPGANVQIMVGDNDPRSAAAVSAMTTVAHADDVGGTHAFAVQSRTTGRYVLIWFTKLPPAAGAPGRYQAEIYNVILRA